MQSELLFSIILPTYNRAQYVAKAVQSVIDQDYENWELLIIDDGSTDNTKEVILSFRDDRVKYYWQENSERSVARNNGIKHSRGTYICFLDSDDYILPLHLSAIHKTITVRGRPSALFFVQTIRDLEGQLEKIPAPDMESKGNADWVLVNSIGVPRWCGHRSMFERFPFDPAYRIGEDKELLMRMVRHYPIYPILEWTAVFTDHPNRTVNKDTIENASLHLQLVQQLCRDYKELSLPARNRALANAWYNVGREYLRSGKKELGVRAFLQSSWHLPRYKFKRKLALLMGYD